MTPALQHRVDQVRDRVAIGDVVSAVVPLGRGAKPRGKCPFHGSKSDSFMVDPVGGRARCWGCQWSGDAIAFVRDFYALSFADALAHLEARHGLDGLAPAPVHRDKRKTAGRQVEAVPSIEVGRWLWRHGRPDLDAIRVYLRARGVPASALADDRLAELRFVGLGPIGAWRVDRSPADVEQAPALVALVRRAGATDAERVAIGVHATFLSPDLAGKMTRRRADGSAYPSRKMFGPVGGGCVMLGRFDPDAPLAVGEGLETVLAGLGLLGKADAIGAAALSLDNLQGRPWLVRGALPLHALAVDPASPPVAWPHRGPVTGLIDADMKPLRGPRDMLTGRWRGVPVIERAGGPVVRRTVTGAERAAVCGALFVQGWRAQGARATAIRPRMGQDFNDAARELAA